MVRRSTPQKEIDDEAFPIRVKIVVPELGFGTAMDGMLQWLRQLGPGSYAWHGGDWGGSYWNRVQVSQLYFHTIDDACAFLRAFPEIRLSDGTKQWAQSRQID